MQANDIIVLPRNKCITFLGICKQRVRFFEIFNLMGTNMKKTLARFPTPKKTLLSLIILPIFTACATVDNADSNDQYIEERVYVTGSILPQNRNNARVKTVSIDELRDAMRAQPTPDPKK